MVILFVILAFCIIFVLSETGMRFLVRHPEVLRRLDHGLQNSMGYLYVQGERKVMQFLEGCGRYSPDLGYTLKPGSFTFSEIEFENRYFINSLGVRDTEDALTGPEIIFLGDSYALGWGVEQEETFTALVGKKTRRKVLNTAIPSYGTVREMLMLEKTDRSRLKCLIIQYCGDDYDENLRYVENGNRPQIMREETFRKLVCIHSRPKTYFFGKYVWMKIQKKTGELIASTGKKEPSGPAAADADLFLHVLRQNEALLKGVPIVVFELNGIRQTNTFTGLLKQRMTEESNPSFIRQMIVVDLTAYLRDEHFYILDGHLNPAGHIMVTDVLCRTLKEAGIE
ncbi:MAG: hypothetical protein R6W75_07040 [Smithellaceae bacterium]